MYELESQGGDGNKKFKKAIVKWANNNPPRESHFLVHFFYVSAGLGVT